jgi:Mrp family chromosome partitioning ATPase
MNPSLSMEINVLLEIAEIKRIYTAVKASLMKSTPACLAVTSAARGEGKTVIVAGLAAIAAQEEKKRILAVDLNWQDPALHRHFGLDLIGAGSVKNGISVGELAKNSGINNLDILTAVQSGTDNGELYAEKHSIAAEIIKQARDAYDIIFVDTSKMFPTNRYMIDPVDISKNADGVALMVFANVTPRQQAKRAKTMLETAGANVLGFILNQWKNPMA